MVTVACRLLAVHLSRFSLKITVFDMKTCTCNLDENDEKDRVETASGPSPFCLAATLWERAHLEYSMNLKRKGGLQAV